MYLTDGDASVPKLGSAIPLLWIVMENEDFDCGPTVIANIVEDVTMD